MTMETTVPSQPVSELVARASAREPVQPADGKSQSTFERLTVDGECYFLKRLSPATDWVMRVTGDHVHRPFLIWQAGVMDRVPASIDHTVIGMQIDGQGDDAELSILMRDVATPHLWRGFWRNTGALTLRGSRRMGA